MKNGPSTRPQTDFFEKYLGAIWEASGELEAEEASGTHLDARSQKLQPLSAQAQIFRFINLFLKGRTLNMSVPEISSY